MPLRVQSWVLTVGYVVDVPAVIAIGGAEPHRHVIGNEGEIHHGFPAVGNTPVIS